MESWGGKKNRKDEVMQREREIKTLGAGKQNKERLKGNDKELREDEQEGKRRASLSSRPKRIRSRL